MVNVGVGQKDGFNLTGGAGQVRMDDALKQLYEQTVPEAVREYLDSKAVPAPKPKRTAKSAAPKTPNSEPKAMAAVVKEGN